MFAGLLKLVPFRDYAYAAIAIAAVIFYNVHVHNLEVAHTAKVVAAVNAESAKQIQIAKDKITALNTEYANERAQTETNYEESIQKSDADHAADLQRLRQLAARSSQQANPVLGGSGGSGPPTDSGGSGLVGLGYVSAELAAALHDARDDLGQCYAERDSLTGK